MTDDVKRWALETFLTNAGPILLREVAGVFRGHDIPIMPLKGVLLQQLVYGVKSFRPISDVDILVPSRRFFESHQLLRAAGFSVEHWEPDDWQVALRKPEGPPIDIDLHRSLTRTPRSRLTGDDLFARGTVNSSLFGVEVVLPSANDLFAHLLLHATLHWIHVGRLHRPEDFRAVARSLSIDPRQCARHLNELALTPHALLLLPHLQETETPFFSILSNELNPSPGARATAMIVQQICGHFGARHPARRMAGLTLAPSIPRALGGALLRGMSARHRARGDPQ
jgi:hypothetical protein